MPDHLETTASFTVSPAKGLFHCFGCGAGGDVFKLVQQVHGVSFAEATSILADRAGIDIHTGPARTAGTASSAVHKSVSQSAALASPGQVGPQTADVSSATPLGKEQEMTSISVVGNLAGEVELRADKNSNPVAFAKIIETKSTRDPDGNWVDGPAQTFELTAFGSQAEQLRRMWETSGNARVIVNGELKIERTSGAAGQLYVNNKVTVDEIGVSLRGQAVTATRPDGARIGSGRTTEPAMDATAATIGAQQTAAPSEQVASAPAQTAAPAVQAPAPAKAAGKGM